MLAKFSKTRLKLFFEAAITIAICAIAVIAIVRAGSLTPAAPPAATSYTLADIYNRLVSNTEATEANHDLSTTTSPVASFYTLKQIYEAIPTINQMKVLFGTSYLGVAGTYNADNLATSTVKSGITFATSSVGELLPSGGTATTSDVCVSKTYFGDSQTNWNLATGALSPTAAYISTGNSYCGVAGTLLANLFNGTRTDGGFPGGDQANGGVDDYNNGKAVMADRYAKGWTQCVEANDYCNTDTNDDGDNDSGADAKDDSTGLIWSLPCNGAGCDSFSDASPATYTWTASSSIPYDRSFSTVQGGIVDASVLCSGGDHQIAGWSLPHQKQLMQAYIDGSYGGNLETAGTTRSYWSATTLSNGTASAWNTGLSTGNTPNGTKTTATYYIRCVRLP